MTIRHLKIFITVADCGKMRKAAELLYISQPSVSQAIREIEEYYGVKLFERLSQRIYITDEGRLLLSYARHIVDSFENMESAMQGLGTRRKIRIGASVSVGTCLINDLIGELEKRIDGIDISVTVNNTSEIENMILRSSLDLAVVEGVVDNSEIVKHAVCEDELVMVCGQNHPLYDIDMVSLDMLAGQSLISRERGSIERNQFEQYLAERGITIEKKWECTNTEAIKNAVINGRGLAILSRMVVGAEVGRGSLRVLRIEDVCIKRQINLIYHKNKFISGEIQSFIDVCADFGV